MQTLNVVVASRSKAAVESLAACLAKHAEYEVKIRVIANGHEDPLYGVRELPDLLLLHYGTGSSELTYLAQHGLREKLALIVCGPVDDPEAMRLAMRAGARDYLPDNTSESDLVASVARVREDMHRARTACTAKLIVVVNGKGGSGASFLATNFAHSLVVDGGAPVTLVDLDLQFGGLYRYLDLKPKVGILQALESAHELDEVSALAFTCEHSSGLRLLAAPSKFLTMAETKLFRVIPIIGSLGCPYTCSFCVDAVVPYQPLDFEALKDDLRFILKQKKCAAWPHISTWSLPTSPMYRLT